MTQQTTRTIEINDRVAAGTTDEDRDEGLVVAIEGDQVTVYWYGSGERTTQRASALEVVS
jgi:hypothetical protein